MKNRTTTSDPSVEVTAFFLFFSSSDLRPGVYMVTLYGTGKQSSSSSSSINNTIQ
jgi:hypothetical protein